MAEGQAVTQPVTQPTAQEAALKIVEGWSKPPEVKKEVIPEAKLAPDKPPETEAAPETAETTETPETQEEAPRRLKLKYRGEEIEKDEPEVIALAQQGFDYTQKSQSLAKEREESREKVRQESEAAQKQYSEKLQYYEKALWQAMAPELQNIDWNTLARDDPFQWAQKQQAVTNFNNVLQAVRAEQEAISTKAQEQQRAALSKMVEESREALQRDIPGWSSKLYEDVMSSGIKYYGYSQQEVTQVVDHRAIKVLHDAMKYRQLQEAKPAMEKKVATVPKVLKPGTGEKPDQNADKWNQSMTKLRKTGKDKDALAVAKLLV